jgi:ribosomal protein S18 acetylase RimI-like enzyme
VSVLQLAEKADIRTAEPGDVAGIFTLATSLFGARQFLYTIYQAPQAIRHLEKLVSARNPANPFVVLKVDGHLLGYYEALIRHGACFLNYIGVDNAVAGQGYGNLLLTHLAGLARGCGCSELALDVFQSNGRALTWYERSGFEQEGKKYFTRLSLEGVSGGKPVQALVDTSELQAALADEASNGFSNVCCQVDGKTILLGLIAGHSCKVLDCGDLNINLAIDAIPALLKPTRKFLIVSSDHPLRSEASIVSSETVLRMRKRLN